MQFNPLIPELSVSSLEKSLDFYLGIIGYKIEYRRDESQFAFISMQGSQIMLSQKNGHWDTAVLEHPFGRGINFQIFVSQIDPIVNALTLSGHPLWKSPWESWYRKDDQHLGQREFLVQDPDGYLLRFAMNLGIRTDQNTTA